MRERVMRQRGVHELMTSEEQRRKTSGDIHGDCGVTERECATGWNGMDGQEDGKGKGKGG